MRGSAGGEDDSWCLLRPWALAGWVRLPPSTLTVGFYISFKDVLTSRRKMVL